MFIQQKPLTYVIISLLIFITLQPTTCHASLSQKNIILGVCGIAAALVAGKLLCTTYFDYFWPHNDMIDYSQKLLKELTDTIDRHEKTYCQDAQLSDWELKERICEKYSAPYQFMKYHTALTQILYDLNINKNNLQKTLKRIRYQIEYLNKRISTDNEQTLNIFIKLEKQGSHLAIVVKKMINIITTLKNRVALFKEYTEDYHAFEKEREEEKKEYESMHVFQATSDSAQVNIQKEPHFPDPKCQENTHTPNSFERVEQQMLQFNLDYY